LRVPQKRFLTGAVISRGRLEIRGGSIDMNLISVRSHLHSAPLGLGLLAFALVTTLLAVPIGDSAPRNADADAASDESRAGQGAGAGPEYTTGVPTSLNAGGAMGADDGSASSVEASDDGDFPWMVSLLILAGGLVATAIAYVLTGRSKPRPPGTR
jgi:hypothetical protein